MSEAGVTFEYVDEGRYCFCTEDPQVAKRFNLKPEHIWIQPTQSQRTKLQKLREEVVREMRKDVALMRKITLRRKS